MRAALDELLEVVPVFGHVISTGYVRGGAVVTDKNREQLNSHRGGTPSIIKLTKDKNGILAGHRDMILEYVKPSDETMKLQW